MKAALIYWLTAGAIVLAVISKAQQWNPNPANAPEWYQPLQIVNRKLDAQAEDIRELQERVFTLETALDEKNPIHGALLRRFTAIGDDDE